MKPLRAELELDLVVANGENVADGAGITGRLAERLLAAGCDCLTLGNHTWRRGGIGPYLVARRPRRAARQLPLQPAGPRHHVRRRGATAPRSR